MMVMVMVMLMLFVVRTMMMTQIEIKIEIEIERSSNQVTIHTAHSSVINLLAVVVKCSGREHSCPLKRQWQLSLTLTSVMRLLKMKRLERHCPCDSDSENARTT